MMETIFKYPIPITDRFTLDLPDGATVLTVQVQGLQPCLWCLVETTAQPVRRRFAIVGTGRPLPDKATFAEYLGTFQQAGGALVWHLFELVP